MNSVSGLQELNNIQTVSSIDDVQNLQEKINQNPGVIKQFLDTLPEKAMNFGFRIVLVAIFFFIGSKLIKLVRKFMKNALTKAGTSKNAINFMDTCLKWVLYILLVLGILTNFGLEATSIVAFIGSIGVTIGLALQGSLSNLAGGVLLLILKPFQEGDYIKESSKNITGTVSEVQIFYTKIHTDDNYIAMIPNGTLANNTIINYSTLSNRLLIMTFAISYSSDMKKAKSIIEEIIKNDTAYNVSQNKAPEVYVDSLSENAVVLGARAWMKADTYKGFVQSKWRVNEAVKTRFDSEGIEIPLPQLEIHKAAADK